jgi:outer membrane lipoprotein-sorting protein
VKAPVKLLATPHSGLGFRQIYSNFVLIRIRQALAAFCICLTPALTGCLVHHYSVPKTRPADVLLSADLDQLVNQVNARYDQIKTMRADVELQATAASSRQGKATDYPSFSGYIFVQKPEDIRVLLKVPILGSTGLDMVSNGETWKLWSPAHKPPLAMEGTNEVTTPSPNALENLRPNVFFDSLLVRSVLPDEIIVPTSDIRILENPKKKKDLVEEPDYDIEVLTQPQGQIAHTQRVIHISRGDLLPYQQDIYDTQGRVVTRAFYSDYQKFGDIPFPTHILIRRPLDQLSLTLTITKVTFNLTFDSDEFELVIPPNIAIKKIN